MEALQIVLGSLVTAATVVFGYLSLKAKIQATGHESRIKALEKHVEECQQHLRERTDQLKASHEERETPWPSDHDDFQTTVLTVKKAYERSGQILTMRDATLIARRMREKKKNNDTKIDLDREGGS